jgi:CBS domain-containing protein
MAKNNKWCQSYSNWKRYFTEWVTSSSPQDLLDIKIFFDFRSVYGDEELADQLQHHINHVTASYSTFFVYMSESVLNINIPDNMQKLKVPVDVKLLLLPLIDFARIYTIKQRLNETNTYRRLEAINDKGVLSKEIYNSVSYYYNFLMHLRLKHQVECCDSSIEINNVVNPSNLTDVDKQLLKSYYDVLEDLRIKIKNDFKGVII